MIVQTSWDCWLQDQSLQVTSATRLFQSGIDEQLIMSHTGHRSIDGVRSYKRISEEQKKSVSGVLSSSSRKDNSECPQNTKKQRLDADQSRGCAGDPTLAVSTQEATNVTLNSVGGSSSTLFQPHWQFWSIINYRMCWYYCLYHINTNCCNAHDKQYCVFLLFLSLVHFYCKYQIFMIE